MADRFSLTQYRRLSGLTVSALARAAGKSRNWVSLRECGHTRLMDEDADLLYRAIKLVVKSRAIAVGNGKRNGD
jgi:transcriptional regulator with XRE-family HTH domain